MRTTACGCGSSPSTAVTSTTPSCSIGSPILCRSILEDQLRHTLIAGHAVTERRAPVVELRAELGSTELSQALPQLEKPNLRIGQYLAQRDLRFRRVLAVAQIDEVAPLHVERLPMWGTPAH